MGAGLRPGAKATEMPPDPTTGAPVLDSTPHAMSFWLAASFPGRASSGASAKPVKWDVDAFSEFQRTIRSILDAESAPMALREIRSQQPLSVTERQTKRALAKLRDLDLAVSTIPWHNCGVGTA